MKEQNYHNHKKYIIGYHGIAFSLAVILFLMSLYSLYISVQKQYDIRLAAMFLISSMLFLLLFLYARTFALKAQDRAIRAEENFRHFILTGMTFDAKLKMHQILALRFAPDNELVELSKKASSDNLSSEDIKNQ